MKYLKLSDAEAQWLEELILNTPYDEGLDKDHRSMVVSRLQMIRFDN